MNEIRDWQREREMWIRILEKQTGEGVDKWNQRIKCFARHSAQDIRAGAGHD